MFHLIPDSPNPISCFLYFLIDIPPFTSPFLYYYYLTPSYAHLSIINDATQLLILCFFLLCTYYVFLLLPPLFLFLLLHVFTNAGLWSATIPFFSGTEGFFTTVNNRLGDSRRVGAFLVYYIFLFYGVDKSRRSIERLLWTFLSPDVITP